VRPRTLTVAYVQAGPPEHGICRYGRLLASEGQRRTDLVVVEKNLARPDADAIRRAATDVSAADIVHLQVSIVSDGTWGRHRQAVSRLRLFRRHCRAPLVFTLHDATSLSAVRCQGLLSTVLKIPARPPVRMVKQLLRRPTQPIWSHADLHPCFLAHWINRASRAIFALTRPEQDALRAMGIISRVTLIPHFLERVPAVAAPPHEASPTGTKRVIVAGFIFRAKGYQLLIEALRLLPGVSVVMVGGPSIGSHGEADLAEMKRHAGERGVLERLNVTGYLADDEYYRHLATADLAICPFEPGKSASGSLSSLIASGCPILASDIPLIAEYNDLVPGSIATFAPHTPEALAAAVRSLLAKPRHELTQGLGELQKQLSISAIYDRHLRVYRQVLGLEAS
jgi:glycosyltransferase involved in cell wall biosynthesis